MYFVVKNLDGSLINVGFVLNKNVKKFILFWLLNNLYYLF